MNDFINYFSKVIIDENNKPNQEFTQLTDSTWYCETNKKEISTFELITLINYVKRADKETAQIIFVC